MSYYAILGLFLLKHGLLAHAVDFGYSYSRSAYRRSWWIGTVAHCSLELIVTQSLLFYLGYGLCHWILLVELAALATSSWIERNASIRRLLTTHLTCEFAVMCSYGIALKYMAHH